MVVRHCPNRSGARAARGRRVAVVGAVCVALVIAGSRAGTADEQSSTLEPKGRKPVESTDVEMGEREAWPAWASYSISYDEGLVIADPNAGAELADGIPFRVRVNSWLQLRHSLFDADQASPDINQLSFERLRLSFGGYAYSPSLAYFFQLDGNSDAASAAVFLDYFISYDLGREVLGCEANKLGLRLGKWKVPFSRSREESGRRLQFAERTTSNLFFDINRSLAVGVFGEWDRLASPIQWETALLNGFQAGSETNISDNQLDQDFAWSARISTDLLSEFGEDGEPDLSWHAAPALRIGAGAAVTRLDDPESGEFMHERVVDSGATLASLWESLSLGVTSYDVEFYTVDAHWKNRGVSVIYEYYWRRISNFRGADVSNLVDHGFNLQLGRFLVPEKLELLARWSRIVGNSGTLGATPQSTDEIGVGLARYMNGHQSKLVFDLSRMRGTPVASPRLDILPGGEGLLVRTQLQLAF